MAEIGVNKKQGIMVGVYDYSAEPLPEDSSIIDRVLLPPDTPLENGHISEKIMLVR